VEVARQFIFERSTWLTLHDVGAVVLVVGILVHLFLHRKWIGCMLGNLWKDAKIAMHTQPIEASQAVPQKYSN